MNEPSNRQSEALGNENLSAFEHQLRSLSPREANFQLADCLQLETTTVIPNVASARVFSTRTAWAATVMASWSIGVAVGIVVTIFLVRPAVDRSSERSIAQKSVSTNSAAAAVESSDVLVENTFAARPLSGPAVDNLSFQSNPFGLARFPWQPFIPVSSDDHMLTPLSRSAGDIDFGQSKLRHSTRTSVSSSYFGQDENRKVETSLRVEPVKFDLTPPTNQREMLRRLLADNGGFY